MERDESGDHSECESRDTSEADYLKVKENAGKTATSDDEAASLCRQGMHYLHYYSNQHICSHSIALQRSITLVAPEDSSMHC